jgi:two-component system phosphate regulon sensor histidine kinase PhoR
LNKKIIYFIISIMSVTLIALVIIQVYWIKNAIMVREALFVRDVDNAVEKVIFQLDRIDRANMTQLRKKGIKMDKGNWIKRDSLNLLHTDEFRAFGNQPMLTHQSRAGKGQQPGSLMEKLFNTIPRDPSLIENRVSRNLVDSLLKIEFRNLGINTQYEFGVFCPARNKLILQKSGQYPRELLASSFRYLLFPGEVFSPQNLLMVHFPNEREYLITRIWVLLVLSLILILTIIFSFTYVITTVFRQKKLSEIKNDFINNMTHEFKTPISTISLACQALMDKDVVKNSAVYDVYLNIISEENDRLSGMAERILQSARLQKGEVVLKKEEINIHSVITDATQKVNLLIEKKGGKIDMDLTAEFPVLHADKVHITNIVFNLLDNAIKYTPWAPIILIKTINVAHGVVFSIKDNGIGINKSNQKKIFDKLYRVPTGNLHNVKGFGLGLSYVKTVVEKHHGKITIDSELKKGSTFSVYLPLN